MFDLALYEKVRVKYGADEHFHHVFEDKRCQSFDSKDLLHLEEEERRSGRRRMV